MTKVTRLIADEAWDEAWKEGWKEAWIKAWPEAWKKSEQEKAIKMAKIMLEDGESVLRVVKYSGLSRDEVLGLQSELNLALA